LASSQATPAPYTPPPTMTKSMLKTPKSDRQFDELGVYGSPTDSESGY
jgi:hypothetical protein